MIFPHSCVVFSILKSHDSIIPMAMAMATGRYEVAPTVVNFTRSLLVSFAQPLGELTESGLSNTKGAHSARDFALAAARA